ncbi:MAG: type 1 glutamine amidotransferase [Proteobacteria bacterium]|nr:type 1 glutamine amidotransferase [Pseudomonadota bacterium]
MTKRLLSGLKVAMIVTSGFEQVEMTEPRRALLEAGAQVDVIAPQHEIKGYNHDTPADSFKADVLLDEAFAKDYDALVLPGGVANPDRLRLQPKAIEFIKQIFQADKPIAAICHGPWTLINAGAITGRTVTSWPSLQVDLINAGAKWVDKEVVTDGKLVTSRKPDDIPAFNKAMIELFAAHL